MAEVVKLQEKQPTPEVEEIATAGRDITWGFVGKTLPNPDEVLAREAMGKGYGLYNEMEDKDPQIASLLQTRRLGVLSKEREVVPASEETRDIEIADFVRATLDDVPRFDEDLNGLLDAIPKGFAVAEVLWKIEGGQALIEDIRSRKQDRFTFGVDGALRLLTLDNPIDGAEVPPQKFLVHRNGGQYENPYGEAVLKSVYWYWWFKKNIVKFWVIFSEKFGMPTAVGKYPAGTKSDDQDDLLAACEAIQTESAAVIPEGMVIELLEAKRRGSVDTYQGFCEYLDAQMAKAILGQTLTSGEGQHGTQALGTVHAAVRQDILEADARALEATVNDHLIPWLVDFNFPGVAGYPFLKIAAEASEDLHTLSERDQRLIDLGLPIAPSYFYKTYRIPPPDEDEDLVAPPAPGGPGGPAVELQEQPQGKSEIEEDTDELIKAVSVRAQSEYAGITGRLLSVVDDASGFEELSAALKAQESEVLRAGASHLQPFVADTLLTAHLTGRAAVMRSAEAASRRTAELQERAGLGVKFPLPPEEAVEFFKNLVPLTQDEVIALGEQAAKRAFTIGRVESQRLIEAVQSEITRSLKEGTTFADFKNAAEALFDRQGVTQLNPFHLETVFRTNVATSYNVGRHQQMTDPSIKEFFTLWRYNAVDDDVTRPSHAAMDGFTATPDDAIWASWYPPNGFRCRCWIEPVNKFEVEEESLKPSESRGVSPDRGFAENPAAHGPFGPEIRR